MVEPPTTPSSDELRLAQLACVKLVGLVRGALSIGLPALVTGIPDPRTFLQDRFRVVNAFVLVLHTVSWPAGNAQEVLRLREKSGKLLSLLADFQRQLSVAPDPSALGPSNLRSAKQTAQAFFDAIGEYANLIQLDGAQIVKAKAAVVEIFDAVEELETAHTSPAR
jgi:hypothetical protein